MSNRKFNTRDLVLVALFAALTAIGAFIKVPIPQVPFTLQYLFCALAGIILGSRLGALSQIVYVGVGLAGLPVFTQGGGIGYVVKPTFGYLIGFIVAAYVIGKLRENIEKLTFIKCYLIMLIGLAIIYLLGVPYLYVILKFYAGKNITFYFALFYGFFVSIGGDLVLTVLAALVAIRIVPILRKLKYV